MKVSPLPIALSVATLIMSPAWLQHLFAKDGGLIMMGGGAQTQEDLDAMHPLTFHLVAVVGVCAYAASFLAIAASHYGGHQVKQAVTVIYVGWAIVLASTQYTHPWNGTAPDCPCSLSWRDSHVVDMRWSSPQRTKPRITKKHSYLIPGH